MLVEVRPIEIKRWHGKKGQEDFAQPVVLECLYDVKTGAYATGLTEEEQEKYEKLTGYDLSDKYDGSKPHPFWNSLTGRIKLPHRTTIFDTVKPLDYIKVKVLKASKFVANSMKEYEQGLFPDATHVIYDEAEETKIKASKIQIRNTALKLAMKLTLEEKSNILMVLSNKSFKGQSQDYMDVEIDSIINDNPSKFITLAKSDKKEVYMRASVLEGIYKGILTKEGNAVLYMGDRIGNDTDEAVKYFLDPQNQVMKGTILEKLIA